MMSIIRAAVIACAGGEPLGMRHPKAAGITVILIMLVGWWLMPRSILNLKPSKGPVVFLGDSLTAGFGAPPGFSYVDVLAKRLNVKLINKGISGDTTTQGLARLQTDVLDLKPALVVVELGGNDFMQKVPLDLTFNNLDTIVVRCQDQGAAVLLVGVRGGLFSDKGAPRYRKLAQKRRTGFVPDLLKGVFGQPEYMSDAIHPNQAGYVRVADRIDPQLRFMLHKMGQVQ